MELTVCVYFALPVSFISHRDVIMMSLLLHTSAVYIPIGYSNVIHSYHSYYNCSLKANFMMLLYVIVTAMHGGCN